MKESFESGELIIFTCGWYSDYRFGVIGKVLQPFNIKLLSEEWEKQNVSDAYYEEEIGIFNKEGWPIGKRVVEKKSDYFKKVEIELCDWLHEKGYIERLDFTEVHQSEDWVKPE
jgi:hypothetical protein